MHLHPEGLPAGPADPHLLDAEPADHTLGALGGDAVLVGRAHEVVALLDEQPALAALVGSRLEAHENPAALELVAVELELEVALGKTGVRVGDRLPRPAVPHDHLAGAVLAGGDDALEVGVVERVVLDAHRQALVARVERGPLGYRPRQQHAVELEPEVPVHGTRVVLLYHEAAGLALGRGGAARRLGSHREVALGLVLLERHPSARAATRCRSVRGGRPRRFA